MLAFSLFALLLATGAQAKVHELIVGTFGIASLYTIAFDDAKEELSLLKNTTTSVSSSWIAFSHDKKALYGTAWDAKSPHFVSYIISDATSIIATNKKLSMGGDCADSRAKAIFVVAAANPPHAVYGTPFGPDAGCGVVMSVDETGALDAVVQDYAYDTDSGVHGMALAPDGTFLYSADDGGNKIWTHSVDDTTGELSLVESLDAPDIDSKPRHITVHPTGKFLYAIMEESNQLAQYSIDPATGRPAYHNVTYPLIPPNSNNSAYWSDEVALSKNARFVWATSRARPKTSKGYISAFSLDTDGAILKQLFLVETSTSGGTANAVTPSEFSDEIVALTDSSVGFVEIWKMAQDGSTATVIAHLDLEDGGCCANAVWYS